MKMMMIKIKKINKILIVNPKIMKACFLKKYFNNDLI